jgi:hypothetical protein
MYAPDIGIECKTDRREVLEFGPAKGALVFRSKTIHGVMKAPKAKGMAARVDAWLVNKLQADAAFKVVNVYVWLMGTRSVLDVLAGWRRHHGRSTLYFVATLLLMLVLVLE